MARIDDEHRHEPGPEQLWCESWGFSFAARDGSLGGFVRLQVWPNQDTAWCWAGFVRPGDPVLAVRDQDVRPPRSASRSREVRADGLWVELDPITALDHWSIGLEAFASGYDDAFEGWGAERGDRVPLGFELDAEARALPVDHVLGTRYAVPCLVHGDVLVGEEHLHVETYGVADHWWGVTDWWSRSTTTASGVLTDETIFEIAAAEGPGGGAGWLLPPGQAVLEPGECVLSTELDAAGAVTSGRARAAALDLAVTPTANVALQAVSPTGAVARVLSSLAGFESADGRTGAGWLTRSTPPG